MSRREIAWAEIERLYRAGVLSVRAIADLHGVSHPGILKRARRARWTRGAPSNVVARTPPPSDLVADGAAQPDPPSPPPFDPAATVRAYVAALGSLAGGLDLATRRLHELLRAPASTESVLGLSAAADLIERLSLSTSRLRVIEAEARRLFAPPPPETEPDPLTDAERAHRIAAILASARARRDADDGGSPSGEVTSYRRDTAAPTDA